MGYSNSSLLACVNSRFDLQLDGTTTHHVIINTILLAELHNLLQSLPLLQHQEVLGVYGVISHIANIHILRCLGNDLVNDLIMVSARGAGTLQVLRSSCQVQFVLKLMNSLAVCLLVILVFLNRSVHLFNRFLFDEQLFQVGLANCFLPVGHTHRHHFVGSFCDLMPHGASKTIVSWNCQQ